MDGHVPPDVLSAFGMSTHDSIHAFPNPWKTSRTLRVDGALRRLVIRNWSGEERLQRMETESRMLQLLRSVAYDRLAAAVNTTDGMPWYMDRAGAGWTAYQYVQGSRILAVSETEARMAGRALAELHSCGHEAMAVCGDQASRLLEVPKAVDRLLAHAGREGDVRLERIGRRLQEKLVPSLNELMGLPKTLIHGDYVLENMIATDSGAVLIDFEFSRIDSRIFDHAAMIAPFRNEEGDFVIADTRFLNLLLSEYAVGGETLTSSERDSISVIGAARFCLMSDGLIREGSAYQGAAIRVLDHIVETLG